LRGFSTLTVTEVWDFKVSSLNKTVKLLMANKDESYAILRYIDSDTAGTEIVDPGKIP